MQSGKLLIAGGSVTHALTHEHRLGPRWGPAGDVDLFVHSCSATEASSLAKTIFDCICLDQETWTVTRGCGVITLQEHQKNDMTNRDFRHIGVCQTVQIILRLYDSPAEVLLGFDVDCCCAGYDGSDVWVLPRCERALRHGVNILNPLHAWPNRPAYEVRLCKYAARGYQIAVPGLDATKIDRDRLVKTKINDLRGLARLLKLSNALEWWQPNGNAEYNGTSPAVIYSNSSFLDALGKALGDDEKYALKAGMYSYDDDELFTRPALIVPKCWCPPDDSHTAICKANMLFFEGIEADGPGTSNIGPKREEAWAEIVDAGEDRIATRVTRMLDDAWDKTKRSREYLNALEPDLDAKYYAHAFVDAVKE